MKDISIIRIVFWFYPIKGGSVTDIIYLSKKINPYLKNQIIIAPDFGEECRGFDESMGIPVIRVKFYPIKKRFGIPVGPLEYFLYMINVYITLKELIKIYKPQLIQTHGISVTSFGTIIGKLLHIPVVGMLHGSLVAYSKISGLYETIMAKLFKPDHAFVFDDGSIAPEKFKKLWGEMITVLDHGIDTEIFKPMEKNSQIIEKLGLKKSDFIVLSTSALIPVKGINLAINSFNSFLTNSREKDIYLLIVGEGILKNQLIQLAKSYSIGNAIKFLGAIDGEKIPNYLSIADVCIATSLYSNLNLSVQEAMASGKPVIVFDSGGTGRLVKHMENGLLVEPGNINDFADKLGLLYENLELRKKIGNNARETIMKEKNWKKVVKKMVKKYERISREL